MNATQKIISGFAVAAAVVAIGFSVTQSVRVARTRAAMTSQGTAFREQLEKLEARLKELEARERAGPPAVAALPVANESIVAEIDRRQQEGLAEERRYQQELAKRRAREAKAVAAAQTSFMFSPEAQQNHFRHFQVSLPFRYGSLYRTLELSAGQIQEFEHLLTEKYWTTSDLMAARVQQGGAPGLTQTEFAALTGQAVGPIDERLRALLGETGFQHFTQFETNLPVNGLVESLAGMISGAADPLSRAQWDQLAAVFATHNHKRNSWNRSWLAAEIIGSAPAGAAWSDIAWEAATRQLETVLAPAQLAVVRAVREQTELRQQTAARRDELEREVRSRQEEAASPPPPR